MKVPTKFFGVVLSVFFLGCSSDKEIETIEEDLKVDAIELSSPEGFKIAESEKGLRELVGGNINIAPNVVEIESVEFVDMENVSIAYVNYRNLNTEQSSNIVIVDGVFNYDAHHLNISDISNKSADGDVVTISCGGCANCGVQGYRDGETGNYHFSCESSCCTMTIRKDDGEGGTN